MSIRIWDAAGVGRQALAMGLAGAMLTLALGSSGCVRISGGSIEISWVLRSFDGRAITDCTCSDPEIGTVRLDVARKSLAAGAAGGCDATTPCEPAAHYPFACQRQTGATPFDIEESKPGEMYEISVTALDPNGEPQPQVVTPAPILRRVVNGQPTQVEAFLLVTTCSGRCLNEAGVCTRP